MEKIIKDGVTFDDVLLIPKYSDFIPSEAEVKTRLTRTIHLNIPLVSSAMDTVTESRMAIALALEGGIGIIHKNLNIQEQVQEVVQVKRFESGMITNPVTVGPEDTIEDTMTIMREHNISGVPVVNGLRLVGILTNRDLRFETQLTAKVKDIMTRDNLITALDGVTLEEAKDLLHKHKIEKLLVVDEDYNLKGLITIKDILKKKNFPLASTDRTGRLICGAAIGTVGDYLERAQALVKAGVDVLVVDTAHGHTRNVYEAVKRVKAAISGIDVIAGNVATGEATRFLIEAGADAVKVGMGPSAICTTRVIAGIGVPQISAILDSAKAAAAEDIPIIADGGVKYSGDITKAIAAGASCVMIGFLFAGTDESPGETVLYQGRRFKIYRGMGSLEAMKKGSKDRYFQADTEVNKLVPEGIEGRVPYKGPVSDYIYQLVGGLKSGMGYCGVNTIDKLRLQGEFVRITSASFRESHPHDITITREAPNYWIDR
ncbi:MAG: IMP dehydrogenase [Candidatus Delongbacteria bacterium]|nr:IMP dehydrogenase [Candidatus Delongbacteria bacterium]